MNTFEIDSKNSLILINDKWIVYADGKAQVDIPEYIYKYYSLTKEHLDALKFGYFGINNPKNFNDPFDCCNNLIIEKQKNSINGQPIEYINNIPEIGVSCFSTNELNPLMWGHYTRAYHGFVVKFKTNFEVIKVPEIDWHKLIRVVYSDNPTPASIKHSFSELYQFIIKLKHWEYENEWRLIIKKNNNDIDKVYYNKECIQEILIGYKSFPGLNSNANKELYKYFTDIIETNYSHLNTFIVTPHQKEFNLCKFPLRIT